jgi:hypothetical protein
MKKPTMLVLTAAALLSFAGYSQTPATSGDEGNGVAGAPALPGAVSSALDFFSRGTNYFAAVYGIDSQANGVGGGVAVGYKISDYVAPVMRLDYLDGTVWMPSASLQLQVPVPLFGKVLVIPFSSAGIATPIAGKGKDNLSAVGIFTAGAAVRLDFLPWSWAKKVDLVGDVEKWSGFEGLQYRAGVLYKFW